MILPIDDNANVTYMNNITNQKWPTWKKYKDCNEEEKKQINLGMTPNYWLVLDKDLNTEDEKKIISEFKNFKEQLTNLGIKTYIADRSPHGFHVFAPLDNLKGLDDNIIKEIKKIYVKKLECDEAKISSNGIISLPNKPHFKNNIVYPIIEMQNNGNNEVKLIYIESAKEHVKKIKELNSKFIDKDFKDYFETDPFFLYIKNNKIPENTMRDLNIFPNLAIACIKSGKTDEEIKKLIEPIIKNNFIGKNYNEFEGWLKKVKKGEIQNYNPIQLNNWSKTFLKKEFYDLTPIAVEKITEPNKDAKTFLSDTELANLQDANIKWLIDSWIPVGDISFIAGKAASFKTTAVLHFAYAIAEGKLVFNKYPTTKKRVLYLNEENSKSLFKKMVERVKKGLNINNNSDHIFFSILENFRLDINTDCQTLIKYIKENNIQVLICDSFRRFIGFDENSATEMNILFNNLKIIRKLCGENLTIIVLHHLKKGGAEHDIRDMLRGTSDIVNSADSVIGLKRFHGKNVFTIEHIKSRAGEENLGKIITIDSGDKKDMAYLCEKAEKTDKMLSVNKSDRCADEIIKFIEDKKLTVFKAKDLKEIYQSYTPRQVWEGLKVLTEAGEITSQGQGKATTYVYENAISKPKQSTLDEEKKS